MFSPLYSLLSNTIDCKPGFQCSSLGHNAAQYIVHATLCFPGPHPTQLHIELCNYSMALPYPPIETNCVDARTACCQRATALCTFQMFAFMCRSGVLMSIRAGEREEKEINLYCLLTCVFKSYAVTLLSAKLRSRKFMVTQFKNQVYNLCHFFFFLNYYTIFQRGQSCT